jgi:LPXTG-motif cell wall-anchored protein
MKRLITQMAVLVAVVCATASVSFGQQTSTSTETKNFEIIAVDGNTLIVKLPEGTRELTVADDFRFIVNGQPLSVRELKAGMKGSATVTTRTTVTPVTVTEVKNGTVLQRSGGSIIVRTADGVKMFSQGELDKRGVKMVKNGKPAEITDFREGDKLTATIVTSQPPHIMTAKEVQATVPTAARAASAGSAGSAGSAASAPPAAAKAPSSNTAARSTTGSSGSTPAGSAATLPKTASSWPLLAVSSVLLLAIGLVLTIRRRLVE